MEDKFWESEFFLNRFSVNSPALTSLSTFWDLCFRKLLASLTAICFGVSWVVPWFAWMLVKDSAWPALQPLCSPGSKTVLLFSPLPLYFWVYVSFVNPLVSTIHLSPDLFCRISGGGKISEFIQLSLLMLVFQRLPAFCHVALLLQFLYFHWFCFSCYPFPIFRTSLVNPQDSSPLNPFYVTAPGLCYSESIALCVSAPCSKACILCSLT